MAKITHCGKSFAAENRYVVSNYPGHGDTTYFDYVRCEICKNSVHSYWIQYFKAKNPTPKSQSDKHNRGKYDDLIRQGRAFIVPNDLDDIPRNTKAQSLACEWTLRTIHPADTTVYYLRENEAAPWVSTVSISTLERKRELWLNDFRRKKGRA